MDLYTNSSEMGLVTYAFVTYESLLEKISDPRTTNWPFMQTPIPTVIMVAIYLNIVLFIGPKFMENRKPFKLKGVLIIYNGLQVLLSSYMLYEHLMGGWLLEYNIGCQPVDYSNNASAVRMANLCWVLYISKLTEFADTIFFVLRKKNNQMSILHLYHHSLTPFEAWICVKFVPGGHGTFSNLINNLVHILMYFYYMIAAMGPKYQKYIWWKKHLTDVQILQFCLVLIHSAQVLFVECGYPRFVAGLLCLHSIIFIGLFSHFYYVTYKKSKIE